MTFFNFFSRRFSFLFLPSVVLAVVLAGCGYERAEVTMVGTPATAKSATFEPAILDKFPSTSVKIVATARKKYHSKGWAIDACRDLGCDAVVVIGSKPRQEANLIQMSSSVNGSASSNETQTHFVYDQYDYQFIVFP